MERQNEKIIILSKQRGHNGIEETGELFWIEISNTNVIILHKYNLKKDKISRIPWTCNNISFRFYNTEIESIKFTNLSLPHCYQTVYITKNVYHDLVLAIQIIMTKESFSEYTNDFNLHHTKSDVDSMIAKMKEISI